MQTDVFSTTDLWLGAFLLAKGMRIWNTSRSTDSNMMVFEFEDNAACSLLQREFLNGGLVNVMALQTAISNLRTLAKQPSRMPHAYPV